MSQVCISLSSFLSCGFLPFELGPLLRVAIRKAPQSAFLARFSKLVFIDSCRSPTVLVTICPPRCQIPAWTNGLQWSGYTLSSGYPMRMLGIIFVLAAMPAWAYVALWMNHFCAAGGGWDVCYELGSVAFPYPPLLRAARLFGFLGPLLGLALLGFDFIQRKRRTPRKPGRTLNQ